VSSARPKFIIWAPTFNETDGGSISLQLLCHRLNVAGETALVWPASRPVFRFGAGPRRWVRWLLHKLGEPGHYSTGPFPNPIATAADIQGAIVVYPEIVRGNPLDADHVVRWFLHRPGHFTQRVEYGPGELYFFILESFNDPALGAPAENKLSMVWFNPAYRDEGLARDGACYMLRKGNMRPVDPAHRNLTLLDPLSHEAIAAEFSRRERCYFYDPYTMYATYAALCGCVPVIVPEPGNSKLDWHPLEEDRWGMAYGDGDVPLAIETRPKLLARIETWQADEGRMLDAFIRKCKEWYRHKLVSET